MKKIIFATLSAVLLLSACSAFQKIVINTKSKGERTVLTSSRQLVGDVKIALGARSTDNKDTLVAVLITSTKDSEHGIFDKGDAFQIRLSDNSEIVLRNLYDKEYDKETSTNVANEYRSMYGYDYFYSPYGDVFLAPCTYSTLVPRSYTTTTTSSYALYLITAQQVMDIIEKGVVKARIENENGYIDIKDPSHLSSVVKYEFADLLEAFFNDPKAAEF